MTPTTPDSTVRSRATVPIEVRTVVADERMDDLDRWCEQYAEMVARAEGLPVHPRTAAA